MRRPNRSIEIFSMSVLDMFASALGAFIMVSVILFPYYLKDQETSAKLREEEKKTMELNSSLAMCKEQTSDIKDVKERNRRCEIELAKTFLVVSIEWSTAGDIDVDLYVTEPSGNTFSFGKNNRSSRDFPQSEAQLSFDATSGPGIEIWQQPSAAPGTYRIEYVLFGLPRGVDKVVVRGAVFDRRGRKTLPEQSLTSPRQRLQAATIVVSADGAVSVR